MMIGEIGGSEEERAAEFIGAHVTKPIVAYIAGVTAPPGRKMGHAGAIISGSQGTAKAKMEALEAVGVIVAANPTEAGETHGRGGQGTRVGPRRHPVVVDDRRVQSVESRHHDVVWETPRQPGGTTTTISGALSAL